MGCLSNVVAMAKGPRGWQRRQNERRGEQRGAIRHEGSREGKQEGSRGAIGHEGSREGPQHARLVPCSSQAQGTGAGGSVGGES